MLVCSAALGPWRLRSKCMPRIEGPNQRRVRQSRRRCSQGTGQNAWARRAARSRQRDVRAAPYTHASARAHRCVRRPARPFTAGLLHRCRCDGSWGQTPPGCSVQSGGDWAGHYNSGTGTNCTKSFTPICLGPPFRPLPSPPLPPSLARSCTPSYVLAFNIASTYAYDSVRPMLARLMLGRVDGAGAEQKPRCANDSCSPMPFEAALEPTPTLHRTLAHGRCL